MAKKVDMAKFAAFCKDTGFIFQSSEIYGGINGFWDYGPLGVELKKNIKDAWWQDMVRNPPPGPDGQEIRMVGLDCSIIMNPKVWVASGHVGGFSDPMVNCDRCRRLYRADKYWQILYFDRDELKAANEHFLELFGDKLQLNQEDLQADMPIKLNITVEADSRGRAYMDAESYLSKQQMKMFKSGDIRRLVFAIGQKTAINAVCYCPDRECGGMLSEPRNFNLMNETHTGPIKSDDNLAYLRPETAQGIFVNFKNVLDSSRLKVPFGIAQIGKAFRNEINPRNFTFRSREFEQMEIEFFCHPDESMKWYEYWRDLRKKWYSTLGIQSSNLVPREQGKEELAHYSIGTTDIEYLFPFSDEPQELEGVAHRGAFDLTAHANHSGLGEKLKYFDQDRWQADADKRTTNSFEQWIKTANPTPEQIEKYKFYPHVIEPSAGADRFTLAVLMEAYTIDQAPTKDGKVEERTVMRFHPRLAPIKAAVFPLEKRGGMPEKALALYRELKVDMNAVYDESGAIGRRYRRQDEVGTPFCITIDQDTMTDDTVTIRDRDTLKQERVKISDVKATILNALR